jgi:3-dehydroquinate synthetase
MRGVPLILIPTTLLAIVDAAIGGKTAINTPYGKNLIGTIYYPKAIFADLDMLQTLPEKEWFNGLAEILKIGLIYDTSIWKMAKENSKDPDLILKAIQGKVAIVEQDPTEQALRRILNFGHTIGHALETVSQYEMSHGEAVALGCVVESHLSMRLGHLSEKDFEQIQSIYSLLSLKLPKTYNRAKLLSAMAHDKKKALGEIRFVLIDKIGHAIPFKGAYCQTVTQSGLEATLDWMESWKSPH